MKVTNIDIVPANSTNTIKLSFRDPTSMNVYVAKDILGLDAEEITPRYYATGILGDKLYDLSPKKKNIILKVGLNPDFETDKSYSELRDDVYRIISSSRTGLIQLKFNNGNVTIAAVSGFVTKIESPAFTKTPEVHITISCDDALLRAVEYVEVDLSLLDPGATVVTDNLSTAPHGFRFGVVFTDTAPAFSVKEAVFPRWLFEVFLTGSSLEEFVAGDVLHFSSELNNKYIYLERGSAVFTHVVDKVMPGSVWPILFPGDNTLIIDQPVNWQYIRHYPTYWGV